MPSDDFRVAADLFRKGDASGALAIAQRLALDIPASADIANFLAMCLARSGRTADAEREFVRALSLAPVHPHALSNLARFLRDQGRLQEAAETWRRFTAAVPDSAAGWVELGSGELALGRARDAAIALERALSLSPSPVAWQLMGSARRALGDLAAAEAALRSALSLDRNAVTAWINLGAVLRLRGRASDALECYERAEELGFRGPELPDAIAGALVDCGHPEEAIEVARKVTRSHPGFVPGHRTLANLLWEFGSAFHDAGDPVEGFTVAADLQPENLELQMACIAFLLEARRADVALDRIRAMRARADHPRLWRVEADALGYLGEVDKAGVLYARLFREGDRTLSFLNAYVRHLLVARRWDAAAQLAEEAVRLDPLNQEAWAYLGTAWRVLDDPREFWLCDYERVVALVDVEAPRGFAGMEEFLHALDERLGELHKAVREPVLQSLRGGSQTPGQLFGREDRLVEAARYVLERGAERWLEALPEQAGHPFFARNTRSVRISGSWSVRLWSSGSHVNHIHSGGWISSAFYVSLPPSMRGQEGASRLDGCIQFGQPPVELGLGLEPRRVIRPETGKLALFPSYMWHGTVPFNDPRPRTTIAFDMMPGGASPATPAKDAPRQ